MGAAGVRGAAAGRGVLRGVGRAGALSAGELKALTARPRVDFGEILEGVRPIVEAVARDGDAGVREFTKRFDRCELPAGGVVVPAADLPEPSLPAETRQAFDTAYANIREFHEAQRPETLEVETMPGVVCRRVARPIGGVGLYVPGGTAVLPSTALMLAVPAQVAGCETVVLATPPGRTAPSAPRSSTVRGRPGSHTCSRRAGRRRWPPWPTGRRRARRWTRFWARGTST